MEVIADRLSEVTASRVNHYSQITVVILLKLNEMISASQRTNLVISRLQLS